jgi:hypothetical protein
MAKHPRCTQNSFGRGFERNGLLTHQLLPSGSSLAMLTSDIVTKARSRWIEGQSLEAGKLIFESIPGEIRSHWADHILRAVVERTGIKSAVIERVSSIANRPDSWGKAHDAFSAVRREVLRMEGQAALNPQQTLLLGHLLLAELVAKITYNATNPPDEFDEDSGWWIAPCLKNILDLVADKAFSEAMWSVLCLDSTRRVATSAPFLKCIGS